MSEIAYGLQFEKTVIGLEDAPAVAGLRVVADVDAAIEPAPPTLLMLE